MTKELTRELLVQILRYEPGTGKLYWLERPEHMFVSKAAQIVWNKKFAGKEAFTGKNGHGYFRSKVFGKNYLAHRIIWLMVTGSWPRQQVDHINGNPNDNRFANLREASNAENARNQKTRSDNTSGVIGVFWDKACGKWESQITSNGVRRRLGRFDDFSAAVECRKAAEAQYGFHPNHGRVA